MKNKMIKRKGVVFDIEDIKERLPHRYPFLMIDRIIKQSPGECIGVKNITFNEPCFMGHFPGQSIMPGTLIAEAMAQTAAFVGPPPDVKDLEEGMKKWFLTSINVKICQPVIPGDQMVIRVKVIKRMGGLIKFRADATVDGDMVASGEFTVAEVE